MYPPVLPQCRYCGWTNLHDAPRCRGCARPLPRTAAPARPAGSSLIGTVTTAPIPLKTPTLQPLWMIGCAAAVLAERFALGSRPIMFATIGVIAAAALLWHRITRRPGTARLQRFSPVRVRTGMTLRVVDAAGSTWTVHLSPAPGGDVRTGDPVFADGKYTRTGVFRATDITNIRTGERYSSGTTASIAIAMLCAAVIAIALAI